MSAATLGMGERTIDSVHIVWDKLPIWLIATIARIRLIVLDALDYIMRNFVFSISSILNQIIIS